MELCHLCPGCHGDAGPTVPYADERWARGDHSETTGLAAAYPDYQWITVWLVSAQRCAGLSPVSTYFDLLRTCRTTTCATSSWHVAMLLVPCWLVPCIFLCGFLFCRIRFLWGTRINFLTSVFQTVRWIQPCECTQFFCCRYLVWDTDFCNSEALHTATNVATCHRPLASLSSLHCSLSFSAPSGRCPFLSGQLSGCWTRLNPPVLSSNKSARDRSRWGLVFSWMPSSLSHTHTHTRVLVCSTSTDWQTDRLWHTVTDRHTVTDCDRQWHTVTDCWQTDCDILWHSDRQTDCDRQWQTDCDSDTLWQTVTDCVCQLISVNSVNLSCVLRLSFFAGVWPRGAPIIGRSSASLPIISIGHLTIGIGWLWASADYLF